MALTVKHSKTSAIPDAGDTSLVQPSDWNADHTLTGTVPVANGGTGASTANDGLNALLPSQTGNGGKVLTTDGADTSWTSVGGTGTVTSVGLSMPTGFSVSGSPVTGAGTLAVSTSLNGAIQGNGSGLTAISNTGTGNNVLGTNPTISSPNIDVIDFDTNIYCRNRITDDTSLIINKIYYIELYVLRNSVYFIM